MATKAESLRVEALELAIESLKREDGVYNTANIIARAQKFYEFITGGE